MSEIQLPHNEKFDLDLGDGHVLQWLTFHGAEDRHTGAVVYHRTTKTETGWCCGAIFWERPPGEETRPVWTVQGQADEHLTLSPSLLCSCGDHGFIRDGKWIRA